MLTFWPFGVPFLWVASWNSLPTFLLNCLTFSYWLVQGLTHIREKQFICVLHIFSQSMVCLLTLCLVYFVIHKNFKLNVLPFVNFFFMSCGHFFFHKWLVFKESIIFVLQTFFFFLLSDNYQVVFPTGYTLSYQGEDMDDDTDSTKKTQTKVDITWILLLRYYIHLQRINNMSKLLGRLLMCQERTNSFPVLV